jgi:hypothetical protein
MEVSGRKREERREKGEKESYGGFPWLLLTFHSSLY